MKAFLRSSSRATSAWSSPQAWACDHIRRVALAQQLDQPLEPNNRPAHQHQRRRAVLLKTEQKGALSTPAIAVAATRRETAAPTHILAVDGDPAHRRLVQQPRDDLLVPAHDGVVEQRPAHLQLWEANGDDASTGIIASAHVGESLSHWVMPGILTSGSSMVASS